MIGLRSSTAAAKLRWRCSASAVTTQPSSDRRSSTSKARDRKQVQYILQPAKIATVITTIQPSVDSPSTIVAKRRVAPRARERSTSASCRRPAVRAAIRSRHWGHEPNRRSRATSGFGPSRHIAPPRAVVRYRGIAKIDKPTSIAEGDAHDPQRASDMR